MERFKVKTVQTLRMAGFNRHGDMPVLERWMTADAETLAVVEKPSWYGTFVKLLETVTGQIPASTCSDRDRDCGCASHLAAGAIAVQQAAGFHVSHHGALPGTHCGSRTGNTAGHAPVRFFVEYDLEEGGVAAIDLVVDLLRVSCAAHGADDERLQSLQSRFDALRELARARATPPDTRALIDAARRRDIPFYRMDREPYDPINGDFRLRPEGLLRLGQARHQITVDGSFCIERSEPLHGLARDRSAMFTFLQKIRFPLPLAVGPDFRQCGSPTRAARAARQVGFPVVLKTVRRRPGGVTTSLGDEQAVIEAATRLLADGPVYVEPFIPGDVIELVCVGQGRFAALRRSPEGGLERLNPEDIPPRVRTAVDQLAGELELLCMSVTFVSAALDDECPVSVIDVDPAPRLDRLLEHLPETLESICDQMMNWLFPPGRKSRIPIATITGTNGKTTTCLMVERIMRKAGFHTGLACSTGAYLDGQEMDQFENGYLPGHLTVIDNPGVEIAILETTRGSAMSTGIGFDRCEVSACLNVTNDHLDDEMEIRTLDELANVKQWIVERGRRTVLNADDPRCLAMAEDLPDRRTVLVSCQSSAAELLPKSGGTVCVVESVVTSDTTIDTTSGKTSGKPGGSREWIVLYDGSMRVPVIAVDEIPTTFDGRAVHNTSNALHAAAIAHLMGADAASIAAGLSDLRPDSKDLPGRMNHYRAAGIDVVIDYAHNLDGLAQLADFCDRMDVSGRRLVAVTLPANRGDEFVMEGVGAVAGRFDHYVCKNYRIRYGRDPHEVPELLRRGLERAGVPADRITLIEDEQAAIAHTLDLSRPGDLVVLIVGKDFRELGRMVETFLAARDEGSVD